MKIPVSVILCSISPVGFTPGVLVKQNDEITVKAWPALFSVIKAEGVIKKDPVGLL